MEEALFLPFTGSPGLQTQGLVTLNIPRTKRLVKGVADGWESPLCSDPTRLRMRVLNSQVRGCLEGDQLHQYPSVPAAWREIPCGLFIGSTKCPLPRQAGLGLRNS